MSCIKTKLLRIRYALESMTEYDQELIVKYIEDVAAGLVNVDTRNTNKGKKTN